MWTIFYKLHIKNKEKSEFVHKQVTTFFSYANIEKAQFFVFHMHTYTLCQPLLLLPSVPRLIVCILPCSTMKLWQQVESASFRVIVVSVLQQLQAEATLELWNMLLNSGPMWSAGEIRRLCWTKKFVTITSLCVTLFLKVLPFSLVKDKSVFCFFQHDKFFCDYWTVHFNISKSPSPDKSKKHSLHTR